LIISTFRESKSDRRFIASMGVKSLTSYPDLNLLARSSWKCVSNSTAPGILSTSVSLQISEPSTTTFFKPTRISKAFTRSSSCSTTFQRTLLLCSVMRKMVCTTSVLVWSVVPSAGTLAPKSGCSSAKFTTPFPTTRRRCSSAWTATSAGCRETSRDPKGGAASGGLQLAS
jgi:hypothetical protein